jgi:hypothetical protein
VPDTSASGVDAKVAAKVAKYEKEKREIQAQAEDLERQRDIQRQAADGASRKGSDMGLAVSLLSIAMAMGSLCLLTKKKPLWYFALLMAGAALAEMIHVWTR